MRLTISIFRAVCALLVGFLLVGNPETMSPLLVQIIGGLFVVSGIISLVSHYVAIYKFRRAVSKAEADGVTVIGVQPSSPVTPFVALGSVALGALLILFPASFLAMLMYVLGLLLVLFGVAQGVALISIRKIAPLGWSLLLLPVLLVAAGIFVVARPMEVASVPFVVLGIAFILYGVSEFCFGLRYFHFRRIYDRQQAELNALTEISDAQFVEAEEVEE